MHRSWLLVLPLLLLTFWLGARGLNVDMIWSDEFHSIEDSGVGHFGPLGPAGIWNKVAERNPWHAPGYFMLLNIWSRGVGPEPPALRAMSLMLGLLTVAWTYRLGSDLVSPRVGLFAAVVLGTSAFFVHFLHEMRVYTLYTFLTVFEIWVYLRLVNARRASGPWLWLAFFLGATALLYIHYFAMLPLAAIALYHLLFVPKNRRWWQVVGLLALAGALFLPWVNVLFRVLGIAAERESLHERALSAADALQAIAYYFSNADILLLALLGLAALSARQRGARVTVFFAFVLTALLLLANEILKVMHGGRLRYLISLWPLLSLVIGIGLERLRALRPLPVLLLVAWAGFGLWYTLADDITTGLDGSEYAFPIRLSAEQLEGRAKPGDVVVNYLPDDGLSANSYEVIASYYYAATNTEYLMVQSPPASTDWSEREAAFLNLLQQRERVWIASMPDRPPSSLVAFETALMADFVRCPADYGRPGLVLELYTVTPALCEPLTPG